ncbi:hypothetical protein MPLSOD_100258 [Mesorhizobium sp. SOD10]|nr:hypothetical protein MPLSOD_100258 [Mesorhizobium sp. SOD10]
MRIWRRSPTTPDAPLLTLNFRCPGGGQGSACLASGQAIALSVTNPFMVTAAFTIFRQIEFLFNRILLDAGAGGPARQGILDFCALHNILRCIAQGRPGAKRAFQPREI